MELPSSRNCKFCIPQPVQAQLYYTKFPIVLTQSDTDVFMVAQIDSIVLTPLYHCVYIVFMFLILHLCLHLFSLYIMCQRLC